MSEIKLKPCPFCGGEAKMHPTSSAAHGVYWARCIECGVETRASYILDDAVKAWNRRADNETD